MNWQTIQLVRENNIAIIKFNRPEAANALNTQLALDITSALEFTAQEDDIWVVIITGTGERAFCAGADLKERKGMSMEDYSRQREIIIRSFRTTEKFPKPLLAAVNGAAVGGGMIYALHADMVYAVEGAKMSIPEVKLGLVGGAVNIPRIIGKNKAKELLFTGRTISATEGYELGLVNRVFPAENFLESVLGVAREIAQNAPLAVRQAKKIINMGLEVDIDTAFALEAECYNNLLGTCDRLEGLAAFNEKRRPVYQGR